MLKPCHLMVVLSMGAFLLAGVFAGCDSMSVDSPGYLYADGSTAQARVDVCHVDGKGRFRKLTIAPAALPAHLGHGDGLVGGEVPGNPGHVFNENCEQEPAGSFSTVIEDFEAGNLDAYTFVGTTSAEVSTAFARHGDYGLAISGTGWIARNDAAVHVQQGDVLSVWVMFSGIADARAYFGFGANVAGTLSFVLAPNTGDIRFQENPDFDFTNLDSSPQSFESDKWYRAEVIWGTDGSLVGNLYDDDGTTLLNSVSSSSTLYTEGGIAFRGTGGVKAFDTVERTR